VLADRTECQCFLTPTKDTSLDGNPDLGIAQPRVFASGQLFGFWGGMFGIPAEIRSAFYQAVGKEASAVFPLRVFAAPGLVVGGFEVVVQGFYKSPDLKSSSFEL